MFEAIEKGLYWFGSFVQGGDSDALVQLCAPFAISGSKGSALDGEELAVSTTDDVDGWVTNRDGLISGIRIGGTRQLIGEPEFERCCANLAEMLSPFLDPRGSHSVSIGFRSSPDSALRVLNDIYSPQITTARRFGVTDMAFFDAQIRRLARTSSDESVYLTVSTHGTGLSPAERKRFQEFKQAAAAKLASFEDGARMDDVLSQRPRFPAASLVTRHAAVVRSLMTKLGAKLEEYGTDLNCESMSAQELAAAMRRHVDASEFPEGWRPVVMGSDRVSYQSAERTRGQGHLFPMRVGRQIFTSKYVEIFGDAELAKRDGIYYGGLVMESPCRQDVVSFGELASGIGRSVPYTMALDILPAGNKARGADRFFTQIVGAMGEHNKRVSIAWRQLKKMRGNIVSIRVIFSTWARSATQCEDNLALLRAKLEQWGGGCAATNETGAPAHLAIASAPGLTFAVPAPLLPGPLSELIRLAPLYRPQSIWKDGQLILQTDEGRPYPVSFGSSLQAYWGTLVFAPSGSGKSFLINMLNAGLLFSPGLDAIPLITMVDVGPSAKLVLKLALGMLPESKHSQLLYLRVRNDISQSVNPMDTQLGCDAPTAIDREFLLSVITTIANGLGDEGEKFVGQVIDATYKRYARNSPEQRKWQESLDADTHALLLELGYKPTDRTFVYDVVDFLFDKGLVEAANRAQRYAMPRLSDLIAGCRAREVLDNWKTAPSPSGELIMDVFQRAITTGANDFAMLYDFTRFDVGNARAVFIDLEEVVSGDDTESGKRRAAMMFLMGRRMGAKNYFLRWEEVEGLVAPRYRNYQKDRILRLAEEMKFLEYDEVHFAASMPAMQKRLEQDLRVGRKYKIVTSMASQRLEDFGQAMVDNCYSFFVLGTGTGNSVDSIQKTFGLTGTERNALEKVSGKGRMLALFKTNKGRTSQVLNAIASPFMQWAFSTTNEDKLLRDAMTEHYKGDYIRALKDLSILFPTGSAQTAIEAYRAQKGDETDEMGVTAGFLARKVLPALAKRAADAEAEAEAEAA